MAKADYQIRVEATGFNTNTQTTWKGCVTYGGTTEREQSEEILDCLSEACSMWFRNGRRVETVKHVLLDWTIHPEQTREQMREWLADMVQQHGHNNI